MWIEDGEVAGSCDCPNAEDGWFCKHQVAVALVWRGRLAGHGTPVFKPAPSGVRRARTAEEKRQVLHDFLHGQEIATLADKLLESAGRDDDIARELQQWCKASDLGNDPADLRALISEISSPGRGFIAWDESARCMRRAEAVLPLLQQARARDAGAAAVLGLHAWRRAWAALQQADDSNGDIGGLRQAIGAEWVLSLKAAGPQKAGFGDTYLQIRLDDPFGCFDAAAAKVAIRKGRALVHQKTFERDLNLWTLERLHLAQLESTGQVDEALALLRA